MTGYRIVNLTPHPLVVYAGDGVQLTVPQSGQVCRLSEVRSPSTNMIVEGTTVPMVELRYAAEPVDLPSPEAGVLCLVSRVAAAAFTDRDDVVFPLDEVRDESGRIVGCRGLGRFTTPTRAQS